MSVEIAEKKKRAPGAGRPVTGRAIPVSTGLSTELLEHVDTLAAHEHRTRSTMIALLVGEAVAGRAKKAR
jgi:hypothetical protein